jgi:hypothetical protein
MGGHYTQTGGVLWCMLGLWQAKSMKHGTVACLLHNNIMSITSHHVFYQRETSGKRM